MIKLQTANACLEVSNGGKFGDFVIATCSEKQKLDNCLFNVIINAYDRFRKEENLLPRCEIQSWLYSRLGEFVWGVVEI